MFQRMVMMQLVSKALEMDRVQEVEPLNRNEKR
jgi:hypothetical protein